MSRRSIRKKEQSAFVKQDFINVAGLQLPQKIYPWSGFDKYIILFGLGSMGLVFVVVAVGFLGVAITEPQIPLWSKGIVVIMAPLFLLMYSRVFRHYLRQRFEISAEGLTLFFVSFAIYAPWENILAYDPHAHYPGKLQCRYGGFVYKESALLSTSVKQGKAKGRTVVQMSRILSSFHPEIIDYLSHYFPLLLEFLPEKEYERWFGSTSQEQGSRYTY